jgi:hypothetical protein
VSDLGFMRFDAVCMMEGHNWRGGAVCVNCGDRLRCNCGRFVRERELDRHLREACPLGTCTEEGCCA